MYDFLIHSKHFLTTNDKETNMISLTDSTSLSIEKTAKLLQSLLDLRDRKVKLPEMLAESVNDLIEAQEAFLKEIDYFLHDMEDHDNEDKLEILSTIVELLNHILNFLLQRINMESYLVISKPGKDQRL